MTMSTIKIGDLGRVVTGKTPSTKSPEYWNGEYDFITPSDIKDDSYTVRTGRSVSNSWGKKSPQYLLPEGTTCYVCIGATIGKNCYVSKPSFSNQQINAVIPDTDRFNPKYVYALLNTISEEVKNRASGAATPIVNKSSFSDISIEVHRKNQQDLIVNILENYDNLIENNNRRIAILEDMAQSLYREWFVNFRYPNHQDNLDADGKPKLIDSPLGQIPEGWEVKNAAEVITINPKTKLVKEGEKPFVGMSGLSQGSMVIGDIIEKTGNSGAKFINGDTLFARITPCLQNGKTGYVQFLTPEQPVGFGSTEFIVFRESEYLSSEFIYLLSRSNNFREHAIQSMTGATGRQRVHNDCFASCYLPVPPKELMHEFTKLAKPMFKSIFNLSKRNENLKQQRDMLLPKLISGQIEL
ncbi:restriction endonuclease subunit S [Yersinia rohdei]|uniref:restriction endonuclease subunit S n=1 Tax=Yersinia rohdei TaxID=29485 RepID=UPI00119E2DFA|nr:restriction endonuclease subunit S [Yersinia rohdei]